MNVCLMNTIVVFHLVQVDIEKKRASRRLKERQQREQQQLSPSSHQSPQHGRVVQSPSGSGSGSGGQRTDEPLDSWV